MVRMIMINEEHCPVNFITVIILINSLKKLKKEVINHRFNSLLIFQTYLVLYGIFFFPSLSSHFLNHENQVFVPALIRSKI
jgi:polyferredoxin